MIRTTQRPDPGPLRRFRFLSSQFQSSAHPDLDGNLESDSDSGTRCSIETENRTDGGRGIGMGRRRGCAVE